MYECVQRDEGRVASLIYADCVHMEARHVRGETNIEVFAVVMHGKGELLDLYIYVRYRLCVLVIRTYHTHKYVEIRLHTQKNTIYDVPSKVCMVKYRRDGIGHESGVCRSAYF